MCGPEISGFDFSMLFKFSEVARTDFENSADQAFAFFGFGI
jgi:hypothetical protein